MSARIAEASLCDLSHDLVEEIQKTYTDLTFLFQLEREISEPFLFHRAVHAVQRQLRHQHEAGVHDRAAKLWLAGSISWNITKWCKLYFWNSEDPYSHSIWFHIWQYHYFPLQHTGLFASSIYFLCLADPIDGLI